MKNRVIGSFAACGFIALLSAGLAGCSTCKPGQPGTPGRYTIEVSLDESLKNSSVIADLVGVNSSSLPRWEATTWGNTGRTTPCDMMRIKWC
jgi:hypothetical protein